MDKITNGFDVHKEQLNIFSAKSYLSNVMKAITLKTLTACLFIVSAYSCFAQTEDEITDYIATYQAVALEEMERSGIPASIKLGQAILESNAGRSALARKANNHFGIKCGSVWDGPIWHRKDDDRDRNGKLIKSCFRAYPDVLSSFIDHSEFLRDPRKRKRYGFLFDLDPKDYKKWARGLKKSGYATNPKYDKHLIDLIERYKLYKFDKMISIDQDDLIVLDEEEDDPDESILLEEGDAPGSEYLYNNDVRYVLANAGESANQIAARTGISVQRIYQFNENLRANAQNLEKGSMIYLQPKRNSYRGPQRWHEVKTGEDMYIISQMYGLKMSKLYERNAMSAGAQPAVGARIKLRGGIQPGPPALRRTGELIDDRDFGPILANEDAEFEMDDEFSASESDFEVPKPAPKPRPEKKEVREEPVSVVLPSQLNTRPSPKPTKTSAPGPAANKYPEYYLVKKGDTLWAIARKFKITIGQLKNWNDLKSNEIKIGSRLRVG